MSICKIYILHTQKLEYLSFVSAYFIFPASLYFEIILLSEIIQIQRTKYHMISLLCRIFRKFIPQQLRIQWRVQKDAGAGGERHGKMPRHREKLGTVRSSSSSYMIKWPDSDCLSSDYLYSSKILRKGSECFLIEDW